MIFRRDGIVSLALRCIIKAVLIKVITVTDHLWNIYTEAFDISLARIKIKICPLEKMAIRCWVTQIRNIKRFNISYLNPKTRNSNVFESYLIDFLSICTEHRYVRTVRSYHFFCNRSSVKTYKALSNGGRLFKYKSQSIFSAQLIECLASNAQFWPFSNFMLVYAHNFSCLRTLQPIWLCHHCAQSIFPNFRRKVLFHCTKRFFKQFLHMTTVLY